MCLIIFSWNPESRRPLILGANRDEYHQRPSQDAHYWPDSPKIFAGRDLHMHGTWLGLAKTSDNHRFKLAAVTNVRQADSRTYSHSRGELTRLFLESDMTAQDYCLAIQHQNYAGFNGLFYDGGSLVYMHHSKEEAADILLLQKGNYALSNARLNTPWPKTTQTRQALENILPSHSPAEISEHLLKHLSNPKQAEDEQLPDTGVGIERERLLSAAFIISPVYGTRTTTTVILENQTEEDAQTTAQQNAFFYEQQFSVDGSKSRHLSKTLY